MPRKIRRRRFVASAVVVALSSIGYAAAANQKTVTSSGTLVGFVDVAPAFGMNQTSSGYGVNVVDYDQDGLVDLTFPNHLGQLSLFRQGPSGTFTDVAVISGLASIAKHNDKHGIAWGATTRTGLLDLFMAIGYVEPDLLYCNNGTGSFTEAGVAAGVAQSHRGRASSWVDFDNDGYLDIYVTNTFLSGSHDLLFRNKGDGTFSDVSATSGDIATRFHRQGMSWADYDNDGWMDVFASSGEQVTTDDSAFLDWHGNLYRNRGDGTFAEVTVSAGIISEVTVGMAWGDYDNDGWIDLFVAGLAANRLYHNNRDGTFVDVASSAGVSQSLGSQSAVWGDFDNDGNLDLFVVNAGSLRLGGAPNFLYLNNGDGTFREVAASVGAQGTLDVNGTVASGDIFGDGNLDLVIGKGLGSEASTTGGVHEVLRNYGNTANNTWLEISLVGTSSNVLGIGARVTVTTDTGLTVHRQQNGGVHQYSQDSLVLHFGLRQSKVAQLITIVWPSGLIQTVADQPVNVRLQIVEGAELSRITETPTPSETQTPTSTSTPSQTPLLPTPTSTHRPFVTPTPSQSPSTATPTSTHRPFVTPTRSSTSTPSPASPTPS